MKEPNNSDAKARFREALEKKNQNVRRDNVEGERDGAKKLRTSNGEKPKMFRRKSG